MKFSFEKPPIYERISFYFNVDWDKGIAITYGDTVYCCRALTPDLVPHEQVHMKQQASMGVEKWWDEYLTKPYFRLDQEIEAYKAQIKFIEEHVKDRNQAFSIKRRLVHDLSGSMYGNLCTPAEAAKFLI